MSVVELSSGDDNTTSANKKQIPGDSRKVIIVDSDSDSEEATMEQPDIDIPLYPAQATPLWHLPSLPNVIFTEYDTGIESAMPEEDFVFASYDLVDGWLDSDDEVLFQLVKFF